MRIAIAMKTFEQRPADRGDPAAECFAEFEVKEGDRSRPEAAAAGDEDVQVTVVLRGKRGELENPALGVTELVLRAVQARDSRRKHDVIDVAGVAVEPIRAAG